MWEVILNTASREGKITHLKQLRLNPQKYTESAASVHIPPSLSNTFKTFTDIIP